MTEIWALDNLLAHLLFTNIFISNEILCLSSSVVFPFCFISLCSSLKISQTIAALHESERLHHPHMGKQLLYFRIEYGLMITVPTHKRLSKHSKTIYVFTYWWVIVTVQIHSRKKVLKILKWPPQNGPSIPESTAGFCPVLLHDLMKRSVCWRGVEML